MLDVARLQPEIHAWAKRKGWWDEQHSKTWEEQIALFHSEVSEALEHWRDGYAENEIFHTHPPVLNSDMTVSVGTAKPDGVPIELADLCIRLMDSAEWAKLDIAARLALYSSETSVPINAQASFGTHVWKLHGLLSLIPPTPTVRYAVDDMVRVMRYVYGLCRIYSIDLAHAVDIKMAYNETREQRHGNKRV